MELHRIDRWGSKTHHQPTAGRHDLDHKVVRTNGKTSPIVRNDPAITRAWLQIHACVVLWGFTAVLGKLITLRAVPLVWWRITIVFVAVGLIPRVWSGVRRMPPRLLLTYL